MERTFPYIVCLLDTQALDVRFSLSFMCFWWGGGGGLQSLPLASSRDGASSRGYQEWPLWLLLEISCCLHGISLYRLIHGFYGGPLVADLHILAIQNAFYPQNGCLRIPASHVSLHFTPRSHTIIQKRYYNNDQSRQISSLVRTFLTTYHANYRLYWHSYRLLLIIPGTH